MPVSILLCLKKQYIWGIDIKLERTRLPFSFCIPDLLHVNNIIFCKY